MRVLVTGFGPFPGVPSNPSGALACAVNGVTVGDLEVFGLEIPTSFKRGPQLAIARARALKVSAVVSLGVATGRQQVEVERLARFVKRSRPDVDGCSSTELCGPEICLSRGPLEAFCDALGAKFSDDAGEYVCNALLYQLLNELPNARVCFVHLPKSGLSREVLLKALPLFVK